MNASGTRAGSLLPGELFSDGLPVSLLRGAVEPQAHVAGRALALRGGGGREGGSREKLFHWWDSGHGLTAKPGRRLLGLSFPEPEPGITGEQDLCSGERAARSRRPATQACLEHDL